MFIQRTNTHNYNKALVFALSAAFGVSLLGQSVNAASDERLELQKFEVTGSHIMRTDIEGMSSVMIMDQAYIERSGASSLSQLFRDTIYSSVGMVDEQFTQGFAPASAGIDLRGMGFNRTLVLVNGRRSPMFPFGQDGSASFVDINLIPLGAVERVEILKDGASAIYGSDAIAGVVNIILREEYEGAEISVQYGQTGEGGGQEGRFNLIGGHTGDRGNATVIFDYFDRNAVWAKDRDLTASADGPIDDRSRAGSPGTLITGTGLEPDPRCPSDQLIGPFCMYDFASYVTLIPEVKQLGLVASGDYEITDSLSFFANVSYTNRKSERDLAPTSGAFAVPGDQNTLNPGEDIEVIYRLVELGPRTDEFETDSYNLLAGLTGAFGDWDWEFGAGMGKIDTSITGVSGYTTQDDVETAIASGVLNPLGSSPDFDPSDITRITKREGESTLRQVNLKMTGELVEMDHGALVAAMGVEYRNEDFSEAFDPLTESGAILTIGGVSAEGDRHVTAAYAEFSIPVRSELELQLAGRYDGYSDFGDTFNPKLGIRWQPKDHLLLRFNASTGFKAPALHELYSEEIFSFESVFDPINGDIYEVPTLASGNPDLDAEESENYSLGLVWDITHAWDLSFDYWRIKNENAVTQDPQFYLNNEELFPDSVIRDGNDEIVVVFSPFQNVAAQKLWGIDLDTGVTWKSNQTGKFRFNLGAAYLGSFEQEPVEGEGFEELSGKDGRPKWRGQSSLLWNKAEYEGSLTVNYVGGYERRLEGTENDKIASWTTVDAQFNWTPQILTGGVITLGAENLFDNGPPEDPYFEGWPFINRALHNPRGRFVYLGYKHKF